MIVLITFDIMNRESICVFLPKRDRTELISINSIVQYNDFSVM